MPLSARGQERCLPRRFDFYTCRLIENYGKEECMSTIEKSIDVNVPEYTAYAQWMKFSEFPQFMEGEIGRAHV